MQLRKTVIIIISISFSILVLVLLASTRSFTYAKFAEIEDSLIASNFRRSINAIGAITADLNNLAADWAYWDDSYEFLTDRNQQYIDSNLPAETFQSQQNNLIIFLDKNQKLFWGGYLPPGGDQLSPVSEKSLEVLRELLSAKRLAKEGNGHHGIVRIAERIFIVSCKNILTSSRTGPSAGWLVMGKELSPDLLEVLRQRTELNIAITPVDTAGPAAVDSGSDQAPDPAEEPLSIEKTDTDIRCSGALKDILGKPVAVLTVKESRALYVSGVEASRRLLAIIVATGVLIGGLLSVLIEKKVISRIAFLNRQVKAVEDSGLSRFSPLEGRDEISLLSQSISEMLAKINASIDELRHMQLSLAESEERFKSLFMNTGNPCVVVAEDTTILLANQEFYKTMKLAADERIEGHSWTEFFHEEEIERMRRYHQARRENEAFAPRTYETRYKDRTGRTRNCILTVAMVPGSTNSSCSLIDITDQKKAEEELIRKAFYDSLTGLPNRQLFSDRLGHAIILARRTGKQIGVLLLDIDEFKSVNDTLGHQAGDQILREIAARMRASVRASDTMARLGGDEFTLMIEAPPGIDSLCQIAEKIIGDFSTPYLINNVEFYLGVSVGIAVFPDAGETPEDLLKNADLAMYESKLKGKNRYNLFTHTLNDQAQKRQVVDRFIRQAIATDSFEVVYQPKVSLTDGTLAGMEALVRGKDAEGRFISPGDFIPYAEANGLIVPIDMLVLKKACRQTARWNSEHSAGLVVAVNISTKHFRRQGFVEDVEAILLETGLTPTCLELEITESAMMKDIEQAIASLRRLREMGIAIALDDFGTGYSSLNYLHSLPITTMKVDKSFIDHVCDPAASNTLELVRIIISLATSMQLQVVAEGVETRDQCMALQDMHCALCQGYYFSKPLPDSDFSQLLASGPQVWMAKMPDRRQIPS